MPLSIPSLYIFLMFLLGLLINDLCVCVCVCVCVTFSESIKKYIKRHKTYFTHLPRSSQWMDLYQIWFRRSPRGRYQLCRILLRSAHGFRFCMGQNSPSPINLAGRRQHSRPYWRYRAASIHSLVVVGQVSCSVLKETA